MLLAVVLSGLGPGAGHVYAGHARRGLALTLLWIVANLAWLPHVTASWTAARIWGVPPLLLLLGLIADSGRLARRAPRPLALGPLQRWWCYAFIVLVTGFVVPAALTRDLARRADIITARDEFMAPRVQELDRVVIRRGPEGIARGSVVALRGEVAPILRRVVGLPGDSVELRAGRVLVNSRPWLQDPARLISVGRESAPAVRVGEGEVFVLPDQRLPGAVDARPRRAADILGSACWILVPAGLDPLRVGEAVR